MYIISNSNQEYVVYNNYISDFYLIYIKKIHHEI